MKLYFKDYYDKERKYECEMCGRMFVRSNEFRKYRMRYNGEKFYVCDKCGIVFLDLYVLKWYINIYIDNKLF